MGHHEPRDRRGGEERRGGGGEGGRGEGGVGRGERRGMHARHALNAVHGSCSKNWTYQQES